MSAWTDAVAALSPYLWWKLDETSGTTAADSSGNGFSGTYTTATLNQATLIPGDPAAKSVSLAATGSLVAKTSGLSYSNVGVSYVMTFQTSTDFTSGRFFQGNSLSAFLAFLSTTMQATITVSATPSLAYDPSALCDGNAHLIVYVVKTTSVELWVDGVMVASNTHSAVAATLTAFQVKQSNNNPTGKFQSAIIITSALTSTQIASLHAGWTGAGTATLAATLRAKTAAFSAAIVGTGTLAGSLRAKTAAFTVGTVAAAALTGTLPAKTAAFAITTPAVDVTMPAELQRKTASFTALTHASTTLSATVQAKTAALSLDTELDAALSASLPAKAAAFEMEALGSFDPVVLVERVRVLVDDVDNPTNTVVNGADGFTLTEDPQPGDVVIVTAPQYDGYVTSITGLGGTWTEVYGGYNPLWMSTDATDAGDITLTMDEGSAVLATAYLLRGLTETDVARTELYQLDSGEFTGPEMLASVGQFVIATLHSGGRYSLTYPSDTEPATDWVPASSTSTTRFGEVYRIPTEVSPVPHRVDSYRLAVDARDMAIFVVGPLTPADAALAGTLRRKTSSLTIVAEPRATLAGTLQPKDAAFAATAVPAVKLDATLQPRVVTFVARVDTPITPVPAHLRQHGPAPVVIARALGPVTMTGTHATQPSYAVSSAAIQRARQQIVADGVDITFLRGVHTPDVTWTLLSPLRYGPGQLDLPQVVGGMEPLSPDAEDRAEDLAWMWEGAPIEVHLVLDDPAGVDPPTMLQRNVYKSVLVAWDLDGVNVSLELGGEANGRAALRDRQPVIFPRVNDIGHQISDAVKDLGVPVYPPLGTVTGIEVMTTGGVGHVEHIQNLVAQAWTRQGKYWTCMPNQAGAYQVRQKSDSVRHATVFFDDARTVARLRRDLAEEPNRIFITGVTPRGMRVRFGVYPGLIQGPAPDFPGHLESGDSGEGVRLLIRKLQQSGYLKLEDVVGGYDFDVVEAVKDLQDDAGLPKTGEVNEATWNALYDLNTTGLSLVGAHIEPAAQDPRVRRVNRSANGTVLEFNDDYDASVLPRDRTIDAGVGKTRSQLREFARTVLEAASAPNWVGDITFHTGALLAGEQAADVVATPEMVLDARLLIPTENLWAPRFEGGTQFNVSACQIAADGTVTATVDTRFRDALEVWDIIDRNKASRNDPARRRNMAARSSTISKDSIGEWDEVGGLLGLDVHLVRGWNKFPMFGVAAEGQIRKLRIALNTPAEFACMVLGREPNLDWLNDHIGQPLTVSGTKAWDTHNDALVSDYWMLFSAGTHAEPCGYWPGRKVYKSVTGREPNPDYDPGNDDESEEYIEVTTEEASGTLTGRHVDAAGFPYFSEDRTGLWIAVWASKDNTIGANRLMWPQLEAGA